MEMNLEQNSESEFGFSDSESFFPGFGVLDVFFFFFYKIYFWILRP